MGCDYYTVLYGGIILAEKMTLETALLLVKAMFEKFYSDPALYYTIQRMDMDTVSVKECE